LRRAPAVVLRGAGARPVPGLLRPGAVRARAAAAAGDEGLRRQQLPRPDGAGRARPAGDPGVRGQPDPRGQRRRRAELQPHVRLRRADGVALIRRSPMADRTLLIEDVRVPRFLYGTAWKEDETQRLTDLALRQGFRGIDTANQRRHYDEAAIGRAVAATVASGLVARGELFLQTKFTFRRGQDHRLSYDPQAPVRTQV